MFHLGFAAKRKTNKLRRGLLECIWLKSLSPPSGVEYFVQTIFSHMFNSKEERLKKNPVKTNKQTKN